MADSKITALTAISTVDPAADPLVIVDVSDTSMAASGTTKKATINQLLGASGTATLASATISGDLTVDTSTLKVDSANNRVGIGTATPYATLHADSAIAASNFDWTTTFISPTVGLLAASNNSSAWIRIATLDSNPTHDPYVNFLTSGGQNWSVGIDNSDSDKFKITLANGFTGSNEFVTIDTSGNCGIGVTPAGTGGCLQLKSGITFPATQVASSDANTLDDYEEGTFTPTIVGTSTAGTATYSVQSGLYTKVGRVVTIQIYIAWTGGTGTGNLSMAGLPFTSGGTNYGILNTYPLNIALTADYYMVSNVNISNTTIGIFQLPTGGGADAAVPYDAAGALLISGTYFV